MILSSMRAESQALLARHLTISHRGTRRFLLHSMKRVAEQGVNDTDIGMYHRFNVIRQMDLNDVGFNSFQFAALFYNR